MTGHPQDDKSPDIVLMRESITKVTEFPRGDIVLRGQTIMQTLKFCGS